MKQSRKYALITAGIINYAMSALCVVTFLLIMYNVQDAKQQVADIFLSSAQNLNIAVSTLVNFFSVYLFTSFMANALFGAAYINYSKLSLDKFWEARKSYFIILSCNIITSVFPLFVPFALYAYLSKANQNEHAQLLNAADKLEKEYFYKQLISRDARLFAMSIQITILKNKLLNKEITETDYKVKLNEIIAKGVASWKPNFNNCY